ncbi:MAG: S1C family serine protease [Roseburia sp.]
MDYNNNSYQNQNNTGNDNFYSYQQTGGGNTDTTTQQNTSNPYTNNPYTSNPYTNNPYQNMYQNAATGGKKQKKKKEKKPQGFGIKLAKCAAIALVFGLIAGPTFAGANYLVSNALGTKETVAEESNPDGAKEAEAINESNNGGKVQSTSTGSATTATDVSEVVTEVMPSIVAITNVSETQYQSYFGPSQTYESTSCGSGIIVSQDDTYLYIATNNHVVDGANSLTVQFCNDTTVSAEIKGQDSATDLAVVKVAIPNIDSDTMAAIKVATLGDSDSLSVGESCIAIGNALGYGQSVTTGVISAVNREVSVSDESSGTSYTSELIQTDAAINPGNSGGALLNTNGEVIGINSVKYSSTEVEGIGYAIPIDTAAPIINQLITQEKVDEADSAYLGIKGVDVSSDVAQTYNMPTGVYVAQVVENSAAAQAGIRQGDIITAFDGREISSMQSLSETLEYYAAGTEVTITVQRANNGQYEEQSITVVLGSKN